MGFATLIGLMVGIGIVIGTILVGSGLDLLLNLPSFVIVIGGTVAATCVKFPLQNVFSAFKIGASTALKNVHENPRGLIEASLELAEMARKMACWPWRARRSAIPSSSAASSCASTVNPLEVAQNALVRDMELSIHRHEEGAQRQPGKPL